MTILEAMQNFIELVPQVSFSTAVIQLAADLELYGIADALCSIF